MQYFSPKSVQEYSSFCCQVALYFLSQLLEKDTTIRAYIHFGAREHLLPVFSKKYKKTKTVQQIPKNIMHVPEYATHHREKFRTETTSYAPWEKKTNF